MDYKDSNVNQMYVNQQKCESVRESTATYYKYSTNDKTHLNFVVIRGSDQLVSMSGEAEFVDRCRMAVHTSDLVTATVKKNTSRCVYPVAAAKLWNSLPDDIMLADSLSTFWHQLKHYLFQQSYPDVVL